MSVKIVGTGTALPEGELSAGEFADIASSLCARVPREAALIHAAVRKSGIVKRHCVLAERGDDGVSRVPFYMDREEQKGRSPSTEERMHAFALHAPPLGAEAATRALDDAGVNAGVITHLVVVSCTGFYSPGLDFGLMSRLGLHGDVSRRCLGFMGCHGAINGLQCAESICRGDGNAVVLVVSAELCTLHFQFGLGRDSLLPNTLFGDAASALVVTRGRDDERRGCHEVVRTGSRLFENTAEMMTWNVSDTGFRMTLDSRVPDVIRGGLGEAVDDLLAHAGVRRDEIAHWLIHPGGPRILESCGEALRIPDEKLESSRCVLREIGNVSSSTVVHLLHRTRGTMHDGDLALMVAFGPGLVAEMALLRCAGAADPGRLIRIARHLPA